MAETTPKIPPPAPPSASERDDEIIQRRTFRDYYIILRERVWIALPLALLISIGYGYLQMQAVPMYFATSTMQFEKPDTIISTQGVVDQAVRSDVDLNTYLQSTWATSIRNGYHHIDFFIWPFTLNFFSQAFTHI